MKIFVLMLLVLATMGEVKTSALDNYAQHKATSSRGGKFLAIDIINEENCAALCNEMPKCEVFTFRIEAEEWENKENTLGGQCRFKTGKAKLAKEGGSPNRNSYVKNLEEPRELPPPEEEEPEV